ncbi:hypothetical protein QEN19_001759 [Hanseniaspora menglaensis]
MSKVQITNTLNSEALLTSQPTVDKAASVSGKSLSSESDEESEYDEDEEEEEDDDEQPPLFKLSKVSIPETKRFNQLIHPKDNICLVADYMINDFIIVLGTELGYIYIINTENITVLKRLKLHRDYIMCIDCNDKGWLMSCCIEGNVSIIDYSVFINFKEMKEIDNEILQIKRVNFNKSLNFVKIHPNFNNKNNKCFFISSFNGSLLAVNLETLNTKEESLDKLAEKTVDLANNWLSYIPTFSTALKKEKEENFQKKLAFDVKITNLLDLDSITYLDIIGENKLLVLDFNNLYLMNLKHNNYVIEMKLSIEKEQDNSGEETLINSFSFNNFYFISINKNLLIINLNTFTLVKNIDMREHFGEKIIAVKMFNNLPLDWHDLFEQKNKQTLPSLAIITNNKEAKNLNFNIIYMNSDFNLNIHETIELPINCYDDPLKVIFSEFEKTLKITILFDSLIIKITPFQRINIFNWFLANDHLHNAWLICEDNNEKLKVGLNLVKYNIDFLEEIFKIQNYPGNSISINEFIKAYDSVIVDYYCYNYIKGYKILVDKLLNIADVSYNENLYFNRDSLAKIVNKIIDSKDFVLLEKVVVKWERVLNFSHFNYYMFIEKLLFHKSDECNDSYLLNCLNIVYFRTNQFDDAVEILYKLIDLSKDHDESEIYKQKLLNVIQLSPKILINIISSAEQLDNFLEKINNHHCNNVKELKYHYKSTIKLMINNATIDKIIEVTDLLDEKKFSAFKFLLLIKIYNLIPLKKIRAVTLTLINLYLANELLLNYDTDLIGFLMKNKAFYDPKEILTLILNYNSKNTSVPHNEELIFLYSQLNDFKSALKLILETGLKNPINYIMTTKATINDQILWREILNYSHDNKNLLTLEILETINKNKDVNIDTILFLYTELLSNIKNNERDLQIGLETTTKNLKLKKLEFMKLKNLLANELHLVFSKRLKLIQVGEYHE